jgi:hypothetical protein
MPHGFRSPDTQLEDDKQDKAELLELLMEATNDGVVQWNLLQ